MAKTSSTVNNVSSTLSFGSSDVQSRNKNICRQGILTDTGKRLQLTRMLCLTISPIILLWGFTVFTLTESITEKTTAEENMRQLMFTMEVGQLIHHLQRERDMSVLYLSALGPETRTFLLDEYIETDNALTALTTWPNDSTWSGWDDPVFVSRETLLAHLSRHRQFVNKNQYDIYFEIDFYNAIIDTMLYWFTKTVSSGTFASVWRDLIAYAKITIGKQDAGVERALGTYFFVKGGFNSQDAFELYNRRVHKFRAFYYTAHMYSNQVDNLFKEGYFSASYNVTKTVNLYRYEIQNSEENVLNPNVLKAQKWFDNMTIYMDALLDIQVKLGESILAQINVNLASITESMTISITCLVIVFFICPFVVVSTEALTSSIQNYAIILVHKTKELSKEKRRTDSLLYQMVPKPIADKLKKNLHIDAEYFKSATVFFIDIFDFNRLVMVSSPIEIVDLLSAVYRNIDERLDSFDVYKVETINDCYMVSSGIPKRNRDRHAVEIANLALVLRAMIITKPFILSGDRAIKLRFGVNTGPCMAGVVGLLMPRYCLFGDTINTASRMKSYGKPNMIQISHSTYGRLSKYGFYIMRQRGNIYIKGKGEMQTYWLLGKQNDSCQAMEALSIPDEDDVITDNTMPGELTQYDNAHMTSALTVPLPGRIYPRKSTQVKSAKVSPEIKSKQKQNRSEDVKYKTYPSADSQEMQERQSRLTVIQQSEEIPQGGNEDSTSASMKEEDRFDKRYQSSTSNDPSVKENLERQSRLSVIQQLTGTEEEIPEVCNENLTLAIEIETDKGDKKYQSSTVNDPFVDVNLERATRLPVVHQPLRTEGENPAENNEEPPSTNVNETGKDTNV
ncbi:uncharacterized protein LOC117314732 [Pecten maximus]|uniref:uncharacterized protein LOC117314732 n=1 Tax=Pecten maximus TaxID=6579 RepID=UPI001458EEE2|nr:uncharacterized protein LOC117314732 [Pecten maximus]